MQELGNLGALAQVTAPKGWRQLCLPCILPPPVCGWVVTFPFNGPQGEGGSTGPRGHPLCPRRLDQVASSQAEDQHGRQGTHLLSPPLPSPTAFRLKLLSLPVTGFVAWGPSSLSRSFWGL